MKKLSIALAIALAAFAGVAGATGSSADAPVTAQPCCKGTF
ncbi:hypothetical protein [Cellulomonas sp. Root137]|nr:hypothetical protein [Cellulomonas sp. Root137]